MSRSAKVARVIPLETPDNSSSEDEDELEELQVMLFKQHFNSDWNHTKYVSRDWHSAWNSYFMWKVEFGARAPDEDDFHGIKLLVKQLFLRSAAVNVSKVTETILNQRYIGSVIKTVQPEEDEDDDLADDDHIYAISTVLNLAEKNKLVKKSTFWYPFKAEPGFFTNLFNRIALLL